MHNFSIGQTVYNTRFGVHHTGIVLDGGKVQIEKDGKTLTSKISDLWQPLPQENKTWHGLTLPDSNLMESLKSDSTFEVVTNPEDLPKDELQEKAFSVLDAILNNSNSQPVIDEKPYQDNSQLSALIDSIPEFSEVDKKDFVDLKKKYKDLDKKENYAVKVIPFEKGKILNAFRDRKLYKLQDNGKFSTFEEFVTAEFGITREYACNLAAIGAFIMVSGEFETCEVSVNSAKAFVINQNAFASEIDMQNADLQDFAPYLKEVVNTTIETAKKITGKDKPSLTPPIVNAVNAEILASIEDELNTYSDILDIQASNLDLIQRAALKLSENKDSIVTNSQARIKALKASKPETCPHSVDIQEVTTSYVILTCGCKFNLAK